jgi:hypothetical protein
LPFKKPERLQFDLPPFVQAKKLQKLFELTMDLHIIQRKIQKKVAIIPEKI